MKWLDVVVCYLLCFTPIVWFIVSNESICWEKDWKTEILGIFVRGLVVNQTYSTVAKGWCRWVFSPTDLTFNFTLTFRSPAVTGNHYSDYQLLLYQTISEHREKGMTFDAIAEWLNNKGYLTVRGKKFRGTHMYSILKKRLAKEELLNRKFPPVWSDFGMEVVDKTILMSD